MRKRFQTGSVKKSKNGRYWIGQWREDGPDGNRVERTTVLGKTSKLTKSEAREKIAKILKPKLAATEQGKAEELIARVKALDEQVKALEVRLMSLGGGRAVKESPVAESPVVESPVVSKAAAGDFMRLGEEQWHLQECYNCHKLKGEGGKKRGPELDNIGSYLTIDEIKQKIMDPKSIMAEGFEKEWEKGKMPDKFKDVMEPNDITALATWLSTFKNTSVNTPKPIKKK